MGTDPQLESVNTINKPIKPKEVVLSEKDENKSALTINVDKSIEKIAIDASSKQSQKEPALKDGLSKEPIDAKSKHEEKKNLENTKAYTSTTVNISLIPDSAPPSSSMKGSDKLVSNTKILPFTEKELNKETTVASSAFPD